jgi:hypothetical protein
VKHGAGGGFRLRLRAIPGVRRAGVLQYVAERGARRGGEMDEDQRVTAQSSSMA